MIDDVSAWAFAEVGSGVVSQRMAKVVREKVWMGSLVPFKRKRESFSGVLPGRVVGALRSAAPATYDEGQLPHEEGMSSSPDGGGAAVVAEPGCCRGRRHGSEMTGRGPVASYSPHRQISSSFCM